MPRKETTKRMFAYPTYNFVDKDPSIDKLRTIMQDQGAKLAHMSEASGVSITALRIWFDGPTRRPLHATLAAAAGALGYEYDLVRMKGLSPVERLQKEIDRKQRKGNGRAR